MNLDKKIKKKLIILVMCGTNSEDYKNLEKTIKNTWFNDRTDDVEIIFYKNQIENINYPIYKDNDLILPIEDGFYTLGQKTLMSFEWVNKNYDYEYIYRSNLGAFVNIKNILNFLLDKPKDNFYCGIIGKDSYYLGKEVEFASGSGYFLSKDLIDLILLNKNRWNFNIVDDVALGDLLSNFNIKINKNAKRKNISNNEIYYQIGDRNVDFINDDEIYHVRLRSDNREKDIYNMLMLYKLNK